MGTSTSTIKEVSRIGASRRTPSTAQTQSIGGQTGSEASILDIWPCHASQGGGLAARRTCRTCVVPEGDVLVRRPRAEDDDARGAVGGGGVGRHAVGGRLRAGGRVLRVWTTCKKSSVTRAVEPLRTRPVSWKMQGKGQVNGGRRVVRTTHTSPGRQPQRARERALTGSR